MLILVHSLLNNYKKLGILLSLSLFILIFASKFKQKMWKEILFSIIIIAFCVFLLCIRMIFKKHGHFPNTHVSGNKAMRQRGITCVQSQDRSARMENPHVIAEVKK